jgi:hypothetical protein
MNKLPSIINLKAIRKNSLLCAFDVVLASGLVLKGVMLHDSHGKRWIGLPSKPYEIDGQQKWAPLIDFVSPEVKERFQSSVLPLAESAFFGGAS